MNTKPQHICYVLSTLLALIILCQPMRNCECMIFQQKICFTSQEKRIKILKFSLKFNLFEWQYYNGYGLDFDMYKKEILAPFKWEELLYLKKKKTTQIYTFMQSWALRIHWFIYFCGKSWRIFERSEQKQNHFEWAKIAFCGWICVSLLLNGFHIVYK